MIRIAYKNLLEDAIDLAATDVASYSTVTNLYHQYLENAMICAANVTTITGLLANESVNCVGFGYHNCDSAVVTLLDYLGNVLHSETIALEENESIVYFDQSYDMVASFSIQLNSYSSELRIGHVFLGLYNEFDAFKAGGSFDLAMTSSASQTSGGQNYGTFGTLLENVSVTVARMTSDKRDELIDYLQTVQTIKGHLLDLFYDAHDYRPVMFACVSDSKITTDKRNESGFYYSAALKWKEAR